MVPGFMLVKADYVMVPVDVAKRELCYIVRVGLN